MNDENREENSSSTSSDKKSRSWNETRIKLPSKYFQFMGDKKDGKGFLVKCLRKKSGKRAVFERAQLFFQNHELRARAARFEGRSG